MSAELTFTTTPLPDGFRIALEGDVGVQNLPTFEAELGKIVEREPSLIALDLTGLAFISSAGMAAFLKLRAALAKKGAVVRFGGARPEILEAFRRMKLHTILDFVEAV